MNHESDEFLLELAILFRETEQRVRERIQASHCGQDFTSISDFNPVLTQTSRED